MRWLWDKHVRHVSVEIYFSTYYFSYRPGVLLIIENLLSFSPLVWTVTMHFGHRGVDSHLHFPVDMSWH